MRRHYCLRLLPLLRPCAAPYDRKIANMLKALENISAFYANPTRLMALATQVHRPLWALAIGLFAYGLYRVAYVPADYQQGDSVRIMFVHVPAAWMSLFGYSFIVVFSLDR